MNKRNKKFNYAVGYYYDDESKAIGTYAFHNEVFYGTMKDAKNFRKYVRTQDNEQDWKIFQLIEVPE